MAARKLSQAPSRTRTCHEARDEDLAQLDLQLALRTPLPEGDDEDL